MTGKSNQLVVKPAGTFSWKIYLGDLFTLTKPRVVLMVLVTTYVGFYLGATGAMDWSLLFYTLFGGALAAGGTMALNQYIERGADASMKRTMRRPLPTGRVQPVEAMIFGMAIIVIGLAILALKSGLWSFLLTAAVVVSYLLVYTPLKKITPLSSIVGGIPGALPPVIGWVAANGSFQPMAWILFAILFFWQIPHLLAISWLYRADYARAKMRLLPVVQPDGKGMGRFILGSCAILIAINFLLASFGDASIYFAAISTLVAGVFFRYGFIFVRTLSNRAAKALLLASYGYLPAMLLILLIDNPKL
jgi:protoheme IX farnesyltransferase